MEKYFRIPYREGGREWSGCDCWGFVRIVLKEEAGIELPLFKGVCTAEEFTVFRDMFLRVDKPHDFDLVSMRPILGFAHVGLYYKGAIFHMTKNGVVMQQASRIPNLLKGYYSPKV